ncbi:mCG146978 [Mus musculus]|nr:mCG146978 [Mus musculus]
MNLKNFYFLKWKSSHCRDNDFEVDFLHHPPRPLLISMYLLVFPPIRSTYPWDANTF